MKTHVCQSCGMPLYKPELFGTDKNGFRIEDYCLYCYKDGQFTQDVTMEEMIQLCAKYVKSDPELAIVQMKSYYPSLKRWAQKEETQNQYHKSINKVLDYINSHLSEKPDLETLSGIANISPYHFHRIFKAIIGENLGEYIQRIRLEYVAGKLRTSDMTLETLAEKTGYNNKQALSKAFKKRYNIPPSTYRRTPYQTEEFETTALHPRICKINSKEVIYIRIIGQYGTADSYSKAWQELYMFAIFSKAYDESSESLGISMDDPSVTATDKCRFYACVTTTKKITPSGKFGSMTINSGLYAIFLHKGAYKELHDLYKDIWFNWLPSSRYRIRKGVFFEKYINNPSQVKTQDILTEVYIPIALKKQKAL